ncbi:hypothetical protein N431DRAFT_487794, partial [Stipitochalara longipes BDJ]
SSSYPSSDHATHGSVNDSAQDPLPSTNSSTSTTASPGFQQALDASRTSAYVADSTNSCTQHRHKSAEESEASHTD